MAPAVPETQQQQQQQQQEEEGGMEFEDFGHKTEKLFGKRLSVVSFDDRRWLIGVQLATLLQRETFNMYRSMKIKNIGIQRASPDQVTNLVRLGVIPNGTHSVTFVPYEDGLYFVADIKAKQHLVLDGGYTIKVKNVRSFVQTRPRIHRRKPAPWDVFRSIRQDIIELKPTRHSAALLSLSDQSFSSSSASSLSSPSSSPPSSSFAFRSFSDFSSPPFQTQHSHSHNHLHHNHNGNHHLGSNSASSTPSSSCPTSPDPHYEYNEPGPTTRSLRSAATRAAAAAAAASSTSPSASASASSSSSSSSSSSASSDFYDSISLMMSQPVA